jgi:PIN domain
MENKSVSNLTHGEQKPGYKHLLVFDTPALLSAKDQNPEQDWLNNLHFGDCFVPGGTFAELYELEKKGDAKARKFIKFLEKWNNYTILPMEDNRAIPIPDSVNKRDRQILACAFNLAKSRNNCVVVLVTYERIMQVLVNQRTLQEMISNFCTIPASDLAWWYYQGRAKGRFPDAVWNAHQRMRQSGRTQSEPLPYNNSPNKPQLLENRPGPRNITPVVQEPSKPQKIKPTSTLPPHSQFPEPRRKFAQKPYQNPWFIGVGAVSFLVVALLVIGAFTRNGSDKRNNSSASVVPQVAAANPQPVEATPSELISQADNGIRQFQQTKDASVLLEPLNQLQEMKNMQGGKLDSRGEQKLSRLKHKYAIEVLAQRNQVSEAVDLLQQIPKTYSDYGKVKKWLDKQAK